MTEGREDRRPAGIDRNVLEWRFDPSCPHHLPGTTDPEGGFQAWLGRGHAGPNELSH